MDDIFLRADDTCLSEHHTRSGECHVPLSGCHVRLGRGGIRLGESHARLSGEVSRPGECHSRLGVYDTRSSERRPRTGVDDSLPEVDDGLLSALLLFPAISLASLDRTDHNAGLTSRGKYLEKQTPICIIACLSQAVSFADPCSFYRTRRRDNTDYLFAEGTET